MILHNLRNILLLLQNPYLFAQLHTTRKANKILKKLVTVIVSQPINASVNRETKRLQFIISIYMPDIIWALYKIINFIKFFSFTNFAPIFPFFGVCCFYVTGYQWVLILIKRSSQNA